MKCTICGKQAPSGAKLCAPCRAALKRARKATVSHFQPLRRLTLDMRARRATRDNPPSHRARASAPAGSKRARGLGRQEVAVFVALSIVVCAIGLLAIRLLDDGGTPRSASATPPPAVAPASSAPATAAPARDAALSDPSSAVAAPDRAPEQPAPAAIRPPKPSVPKLAPGIWPMEDAANRHGATQVATVSLDAFGNMPERPAPPPAPAAAPAPPPEPAVPDRWESMNDAIAGCSRQGGLTGVVCELRVRTESCEGYWGRVPQCPAGVAGDH